jgi:hypothetical protein
MSTRKQPHQRSARRSSRPATHAHSLHRLRSWLLPKSASFSGLTLHGNASWRPVDLIWTALCWAWSESRNVTDAFESAAFQCRQLGIAALSTYQGFMNALVQWTDPLMEALWPVLHQRLSEIGGRHYRLHGWVPIAFDGSRSSAPRTESNERALCAANYGQGKTAQYRKKKTKGMRRRQNERNKPQPPPPQVWITMLWHIGLRLPWMWRLGPSNSSEREHVLQMLARGNFPKNTLFCGDAGFVGYPLWSRIRERGFHFLVRVGANVSLLSEAGCRIQRDGRVLSWPQAARLMGKPPLPLRLLKVRIGQRDVWMLTSVLPASRLSAAQITRLYQLRWGIEVEFRGLKQTLDRGKLRCRNDRRVFAELHWSLLAMAVAELMALKEQLAARSTADGGAVDPRRRSLANAMRALRHALARIGERPPPGRDVSALLRLAVTDAYRRHSSKTARYRPPNPDARPCGNPKLRRLTLDERIKLANTNTQKNAA